MKRFTKIKSTSGNVSGQITIDAKNNEAVLVGTSTGFRINSANLDLIVINSDVPTRLQIKEIINVNSSYIMTLESNTKYYGDGVINISNNSNSIIMSQNVATINLIANDIISFEYLDNIVESMILSGSGKNYVLNTANSFFTNTANLLHYHVYPIISNAKYEIIRTYYNDPDAPNPDNIVLTGTSESPNMSTYTNPGESVTVAWKFTPAGSSTYIDDGSELPLDGVWCDPSPINDYWIRGTYESGDAVTGGNSLGVWYKVSGAGSDDVEYQWSSASAYSGVIKIEISSDSSGSVVLATGYYGGEIVFT